MKSRDEILVFLMNLLAEKLKEALVLKGGMLLRLYQCPRFTQDIDYVWVSKQSRKVLAEQIKKHIEGVEWLEILEMELNSRGVFLELKERGNTQKVLLEISVAKSTFLPSEPMTTVNLSEKYQLQGRIITTMALPEAYSNKIAAAIERDVMRDLYDLSQFETLGNFDETTLKSRLNKVMIRRGKEKKISFREAAERLEEKKNNLTQKRIEQELHPLLPENYRPGILKIIQAALGRLVQRLRALDSYG